MDVEGRVYNETTIILNTRTMNTAMIMERIHSLKYDLFLGVLRAFKGIY